MKSRAIFPYRLFRWFITKQILVAGGLLVVLDIALLLWLERRTGWSSESMEVGRQIVLLSLVSAATIVVGVSIFMARKLMIPLGRLIEKTKRLHRFPFEEEGSLTQLDYDEPGEWYDLERALNELGRKLQQKTIRLSREKTELRAIMSSINEAVLAIGHDRRPLFFNSQAALLFDVDQGALSESAVGEIIRSPDLLHAYEECLKTGAQSRVDVSLEKKGGGTQYFWVSFAPLRKKHNQEIYGAVAVFYDITELKKAEQIRIEFVGNVSHELRTPLTSINGYLQTVIQDIRSGKIDQTLSFLEIVSKNVDRLKHLVDDLLDLSSLQAGVELKRSIIHLPALTESVLRQVDCRDHQVFTHFDVMELYADEGRVEQVLRNLVQNAARYVPRGGKIEIRWLRVPSGSVILSVKDNGPGIAKEHQGRLFERFYRIDSSRARNVGGTGIGLSLVKHIMQRHKGQVRVESEEGKGAEFICEFTDT